MIDVKLITDADLKDLQEIKKRIANTDATDELTPDYYTWDLLSVMDRIEHNLKNGLNYYKPLPETETHWYDADCESCGWSGSSEYCGGGHAIADTGDYSDPTCPICGSDQIN